MTHPNLQRHVVPTTILTKSKLVLITAAKQVTTTVSPTNVTRPRPAKKVVTKPYSPPKRTINRRPSPPASNFPPKVTTDKAPKGNPQHALKDKGVIDSGCSRYMIGNMFYLSDFKEINGRYVAFGENPNGGKIFGKDIECIVLSLEFKLSDESQVLIRVPRENNMYNVDLKNIVPSRDLTCLFAKATLDEVLVTKPHNKTPYELLLGRSPTIGFMRPFGCLMTIPNTLDPLGKFVGKDDEGFLAGYSGSSKAFRVFNSRTRIVQEILHLNFLENKPNVAGSGPTWLFDIDTLTKSMNY
nr:retrovirus-related Pol polyprotein from transposon TNT 1-94 [Tanacetum cinerariifolium]